MREKSVSRTRNVTQANKNSFQNLVRSIHSTRIGALRDGGIDEVSLGGFRLFRHVPSIPYGFPFVEFAFDTEEALKALRDFASCKDAKTDIEFVRIEKPYVCIVPSSFPFTVSFSEEYVKTANKFRYRLVPYGHHSRKFPVVMESHEPLWDVHHEAYSSLFIRNVYPRLYSILSYARCTDSDGQDIDLDDYSMLPYHDDTERFLSEVPYAPYIRHMTETSRGKVSYYARGNHCVYQFSFYPRFLTLLDVLNDTPRIDIRIFPVDMGYRFTYDSFRSLMNFFVEAMQMCIPGCSPDRVLFHADVSTLTDFVPSDDVMSSWSFTRKKQQNIYPVWYSPLCRIGERGFSDYGFMMREYLSLSFPRLHDCFMRHTLAKDMSQAMMRHIGWNGVREISYGQWSISIKRDIFSV